MRRGDIWEVDLESVRGSEAAKRRPVVVVSNDFRNRASQTSGRGVITVVPLTSNTARVLPFQVLVAPRGGTGLAVESKAQAEQVRAVDVGRFVERRGRLDPVTLTQLDRALLLHLDLES